METRAIDTLTPNPNNNHDATHGNYNRLLKQMAMGDHSTFLITPEGMVIDGNNRLKAAKEVGWEQVACRILSYEHDPEKGYYAVIDGQVVRDPLTNNIPFYYSTLDDMYLAYGLSRNGRAAAYDQDKLINIMPQRNIDWDTFTVDFFPPKTVQETVESLAKRQQQKRYEIIIPCISSDDLDAKYNQVISLGMAAKKRE